MITELALTYSEIYWTAVAVSNFEKYGFSLVFTRH